MQIIIDISEEEYAIILGNAYVIRKRKKNTLEGAVLSGTPLPKGHGRLIDADRFINDFACHGYIDDMGVGYFRTVTPTIIDADKSGR